MPLGGILLRVAVGALSVAAVSGAQAAVTRGRIWSDGPIVVEQVSSHASRLCVLTKGFDGGVRHYIHFVKDADGKLRFYHFIDHAAWKLEDEVVIIDGVAFSLHAKVIGTSGLLELTDFGDDFVDAFYNGSDLTFTLSGGIGSFSLAGSAAARTPMDRCAATIARPSASAVTSPRPAYQQASDEAALALSSLPPNFVPPTPAAYASPPPAHQQVASQGVPSGEAALVKEMSTYRVEATLNGTTPVMFVLDSGASDVSIPRSLVLKLEREGSLSLLDVLGDRTYVMADGRERKEAVVLLRSITVGGRTAANVECSIAEDGTDPLLGQSFLKRFKSVTIDYSRNVLIIGS